VFGHPSPSLRLVVVFVLFGCFFGRPPHRFWFCVVSFSKTSSRARLHARTTKRCTSTSTSTNHRTSFNFRWNLKKYYETQRKIKEHLRTSLNFIRNLKKYNEHYRTSTGICIGTGTGTSTTTSTSIGTGPGTPKAFPIAGQTVLLVILPMLPTPPDGLCKCFHLTLKKSCSLWPLRIYVCPKPEMCF
jgi:hypothetical protein